MFKSNKQVRTAIYLFIVVGGLITGAAQAGFNAAEVAPPTAYVVALSVFNFLASGAGLVALINLTPDEVLDREMDH